LIASASTARSTSTTFSDKLTFADKPSSDLSTRATSTSTIKREEKEKPGTVIVGRRY